MASVQPVGWCGGGREAANQSAFNPARIRSIPIGKGKQENTITTNVLILVPSLPPPSTCSPLPALHGIVVTGIELVAAPFAANFRLPEQWQDADAYLALGGGRKSDRKSETSPNTVRPESPELSRTRPEPVPVSRGKADPVFLLFLQHGIVFALPAADRHCCVQGEKPNIAKRTGRLLRTRIASDAVLLRAANDDE